MANKWKLKFIRPKEVIEIQVRKAWAKAMKDLAKWMKKELIHALTYGGMGIDGIADTEFYKFISSDDGLSQLGINRSQPPRLLKAYERQAFKIVNNNSTVALSFGDVAKLKLATPHPATGEGHLQIRSWLEWIVDGKEVKSGYVPRSDLPKSQKKHSRLRAPLGGLMLPRGVFNSTGLWRFPSALMNYEDKWLKSNVKAIEEAILSQALVQLQKHLK